eukprot:TRINITY_DN29882_c0_g2_i1.p1 TRINITY_DN29882_c0_g2~~TRINITY_DN29882_c0_g2_i1.p1  ORF type:complete len:507 (-),score=98.16 TRINITY_DN29882_c0_g2_i1:451-1971(-)
MRSLWRHGAFARLSCSYSFRVTASPKVPQLFGSSGSKAHRIGGHVLPSVRGFAAGSGKDFYALLGVSPNASEKEIKKAYKKLVVKHHPDKGGDEEKFKEINRAYEVLGDSEKRARYDRFGEEGVDGDGAPQSAEDIFSQFFGGGRRGRPQRQRTQDKVQPLKVTLEQMFAGQHLRVGWARQVIDRAVGSQTCSACGGRGVIVQMVRMGPMVQQIQSQCGECGGTGQIVQMKGQRETLEVDIPKGAVHGQKIKFPGMADEHPNADTGDVVLILREESHKEFKRRGADLFVERDISLVEALCGFEIEITHLDGRKILIKSAPGEVVKPLPRGFDPLAVDGGKMEWEPMEGFDCPSLPTVAQAETSDLETLTTAIETQLKRNGIQVGAFVVDGHRAYFKQGTREQILAAKTQSSTCTMYVVAGADKTRSMKVVKGEGMPTFKDPNVRGNLFLLLNIQFPDSLTDEARESLRNVLPPSLSAPAEASHDVVYDATNMDPVESFRENKARMP